MDEELFLESFPQERGEFLVLDVLEDFSLDEKYLARLLLFVGGCHQGNRSFQVPERACHPHKSLEDRKLLLLVMGRKDRDFLDARRQSVLTQLQRIGQSLFVPTAAQGTEPTGLGPDWPLPKQVQDHSSQLCPP